LDIIKGQNELLFLSNSINYFLESHKTRTGIDRGISYALQYDIAAVSNHLNKRKDLRFPGYLLHQFISLAETIKDLNIFYTSILHDGHVPTFEEQDMKEELHKRYGIDNRKGEIGMYVPYEIKMQILRNYPSVTKENQKEKSLANLSIIIKDMVSTRESQEINDSVHGALYILKEELVSNEELEYQIVKMLKILPDKKIIVQSGM
jgi:hypothetical protein